MCFRKFKLCCVRRYTYGVSFQFRQKKRTRQTCFWHGIVTYNNRNNNTTCMYHSIVGLLNKMRDFCLLSVYISSLIHWNKHRQRIPTYRGEKPWTTHRSNGSGGSGFCLFQIVCMHAPTKPSHHQNLCGRVHSFFGLLLNVDGLVLVGICTKVLEKDFQCNRHKTTSHLTNPNIIHIFQTI